MLMHVLDLLSKNWTECFIKWNVVFSFYEWRK